MRTLDKKEEDLFEVMLKKLQNDPDKYERMFAAQYLAKYNFSKSKKFLEEALNDYDPEVVQCILQQLKKMLNSQKHNIMPTKSQ